MRAVAYARVSSVAQRERDTIASQLRMLPEYVARMNWTLVRPIDTYVDDGHTAKAGKLAERRGLQALLRDAALDIFDVVVVVDLDRLTRSENLGERGLILGVFQDANVLVASAMTGEVMDLRTDHGDLMASLKTYLAAAENRKRSERVRQGKIQQAQRGGKIGSIGPYGLRYDKFTNVWSIDPVTGLIVRELFERVAAGESCYALSDDLNRRGIPGHGPKKVWHRGRVYDLIRSRHPVGEYLAHGPSHTIVTVPAIIDEALWQRAQAALIENRKSPLRKTKHVYLLEQLGKCGACGGRMMVQSGCLTRGRFWRAALYICEYRKFRKMGPDRCTAPKVRIEDADDRAWAAICRELEDPELPAELAADRRAIAADAHDWDRDADGYRTHLARLEKVAAAVLVRFRRGAISEGELDGELAAVNRERAAVHAQLRTAERARGATISAQERLRVASATMERMRTQLAKATPAERREIALTLIDPGGAEFRGTSVVVDLWVERPRSSSDSSGALADATSCSVGDESYLKIRLVA